MSSSNRRIESKKNHSTYFNFRPLLNKLYSLIGINNNNYDEFFTTLKELKNSSHLMSDDEKKIINNFLKFCKKDVDDVVIPRANIRAIEKNANLDDITSLITKYSHTRIIVYSENLDNIIGFIHIKDLFNIIARKQNFNLKKIIRTHIIAPSSMKLIDLLAEMQRRRVHMAVVVDEYGDTSGLVTIEDIMEEIVGEIEDEFDEDKNDRIQDYKIIDDTSIIVSSRVDVETIEEILNQKLKEEEDEFDTIGGLILAKIGHVATNGMIVKINYNVVAEILSATPRTIKRVKLTLKTGKINYED